jgi:hypothetical protein
VTIGELEQYEIKENTILWGTTVTDPCLHNDSWGLTLIIEDKDGAVIPLTLFNQVRPTTTQSELNWKVRKGIKVGIM